MNSGRAIDHVVLLSDNLDAAAAQYEKLGFDCTPRAKHEDRMGTSNRLVQLAKNNFIELLEVDRPQLLQPHDFAADPPFFNFGAHNRDWIGQRPGMSMLVYAGQDSRADHARFLEKGIQTYAPFDFQRLATLPDGSQVTVSFKLTFVTSPAMPAIAFFVCQNCAPEHFWKPAFQQHANGALGIEAMVIASDSPERDAQFLSGLFDGEVSEIDGGFSVANGASQRTEVLEPDVVVARGHGFSWRLEVGPMMAGLVLHTSKPEQSAIDCSEACGAFIEWSSSES